VIPDHELDTGEACLFQSGRMMFLWASRMSALQVKVILEERAAGQTIICGPLQPFHCFGRFVDQRIGAGTKELRMMNMRGDTNAALAS